MDLELIYPHKNVYAVNPSGFIVIVTCWTLPETFIKDFCERHLEVWKTYGSKVAAIGTLYGNGFSDLVRNLAYNPGIRCLVVTGRDRSDSGVDLARFYSRGTEDYSAFGAERKRIVGGKTIVDADISLERLAWTPIVYQYTYDVHDWADKLAATLTTVAAGEIKGERQKWDVPKPILPVTLPTNIVAHQVIAPNPYEAYIRSVQRIATFGVKTTLPKGERYELQGLKVVINDSTFSDEVFDKLGKISPDFTPANCQKYFDETFSGDPVEGLAYTYGSRIGSAFADFSTRLSRDIQDRKCFHSLWLPSDIFNKNAPCLSDIYVRSTVDGYLNMFASFRTHNALSAWPMNVYALSRCQHELAAARDLMPGQLVVYSRSISVDDIGKAVGISALVKYRFEPDPLGQFIVDISDGFIVMRLLVDGLERKTLRANTAQKLHYELIKQGLIQDPSHALYLGRQLQKAEYCLQNNISFVQD